jgi:acyl-coenzyme A synthetase/AMP-(fatty) acid ligase
LPATAAQLIADARQVTGTMGIRASDLNYALIPFGHAYGLGSVSVPLIAQGVPAVCGSLPLPHAIAADFARWQPNVFPTVPAVFRALASSELGPDSLASLRLAVSAGAPLPPEVAKEFATRFGKKIHAFYGSSETGGIAYDRTGAETLRGGVGRALDGVRITRARGGHIRISSAAVFTVGNSRRVGAHGAWTPPDRVEIDPRGNLTLLGRRGAIVKIAGRRVNLAEVVARLRRVTGVREVWVGVNGGGTEPVLGAALATSRPASEIRAELLADTAPWKIPKRWSIFAEFPLTSRGKTDSRALHEAVFR